MKIIFPIVIIQDFKFNTKTFINNFLLITSHSRKFCTFSISCVSHTKKKRQGVVLHNTVEMYFHNTTVTQEVQVHHLLF